MEQAQYPLERHGLSRWLFLLLACLLLSTLPKEAHAQSTVSGRVVSTAGEALAGVTVVVRGTSNGASTDANGNFTLTLAPGQENGTLVFSYIGFRSQEVPIAGQTTVNVTLQSDEQALSEVVVIGYQTVRKEDLTGAVSVVDASDARRVTANTVAESLQGLAAGVTVRTTGAPGAGAKIDIRGTGTFGANEPLYVIDGMLSNATPDFNPNDIESIQVLKDASAAAIYGSRAANGVIIITTRRGKEGPLQITGNVKTGIQQFRKRWDLMNSTQFAELNRQAYAEVGVPPQTSVSTEFDPNVDTDWQEALMRTGSTQDYNLSLSGGSQTGTFLVSGNYFNNKGTIIDNSFERANFRINTTGERGRFSFGEFLLLSYTHDDYLEGNPLVDMLRMLPTMPIQSSRYVGPNNPEGWSVGDPVFANTFAENPIALQNLLQRDLYSYKIRGNAFVQFEILEGLAYKFNAGLESSFDNFRGFRRPGVIRQNTPNVRATADENRAQFLSTLFEHTVNFERQFGEHNVSAVAGISNQIFKYEQIYGQKQNLPFNSAGQYYTVLNQGDNPIVGSFRNEWAILGYLGRINYSFADKYLLSASFRRDGDSRFGPDYRWGNFPSVSVAWRISEEPFFTVPGVSDLKLRASYGALGNSEVLSPWQYFGRISPFPRAIFGPEQSIAPGAINIQLANQDLHWEEKKTTNFGVDAAFLNNRLSVTAEYFISETEDVLTNLPVPLTTGNAAPAGTTSSPPVNAASLRNTGVELSATLRSAENPFQWDLNVNLTHIKNEVIGLGNLGEGRTYIQSGDARTQVGRAIGEWYVLKTDGIFQSQQEIDAHRVQPNAKPGDIRYVDADGNGILDVDKDRTYVGSPWPDIQGGIVFNASYNNFTFSMQWYGVAGNKIYNRPRYWTDRGNENASYRSDYSPWTPTNTDTEDPRIGFGTTDPGIQLNARPDTDRWLEDGSYLRLRNLEIGYNLPVTLLQGIGVQTARVSLSGQNLVTFTKYTGLDPDIVGVNIFERGLDNGQYPALRIFSLGVQFGF